MACKGSCTITKYETTWEYTAKPLSAGSDCRGESDEDIEFYATENVEEFLSNKYPDTPSGCGKGCECVELENQNPTPTKWSGWFVHNGNFNWSGNCRIGYSIKYKYRSRLYNGNCQIKTKKISFGDPLKSKPSPKDIPVYNPDFFDETLSLAQRVKIIEKKQSNTKNNC